MAAELHKAEAFVKKDWPWILLVGAGGFWLLFMQHPQPPAPGGAGSKKNTSSPSSRLQVIGGQRGQQARSSSRSSNPVGGAEAAQLLSNYIQGYDQLQGDKLQLQGTEFGDTTQQNIAYRQSNVAVQEQLNQLGAEQAMQPPWWQQLLSPILQDLPMAFGFPPIGGGAGGYGGGSYGSFPGYGNWGFDPFAYLGGGGGYSGEGGWMPWWGMSGATPEVLSGGGYNDYGTGGGWG